MMLSTVWLAPQMRTPGERTTWDRLSPCTRQFMTLRGTVLKADTALEGSSAEKALM
jgi:hypothetical protein